MLTLRKGDKVAVRCGKDKGKVGQVLKLLSAKKRVIVEGVNLVKRHMRKRSEQEQGGIKEIPGSVHISNVNLFCSSCNRGVRVSVKAMDDKSKVRICKRCKKAI